MELGWLWLSILNTTAWPPPISITPAFSPGPWITQGALVGSPRRWMREDLYEQCSFHIAEKMPSSVKLGSRPISLRMRSYSSGFSPWAATISGVILGSLLGMDRVVGTSDAREKAFLAHFHAVQSFGKVMRGSRLHIGDGSDLRAWLPIGRPPCRERACQICIPQPSRPAYRHRRRIHGMADLDPRRL